MAMGLQLIGLLVVLGLIYLGLKGLMGKDKQAAKKDKEENE